jgi:hypothetical protein
MRSIPHPRFALPALAALLALTLAAPAQATTEHTFDPLLSLRGNCSTSATDEVPDPGLCPGTPSVDHPPKAFEEPCGTAVDRHGDIYVSNAVLGSNGLGTNGRIDVFNPKGEYLTSLKDEHAPCKIAVDSQGNVYVAEYQSKDAVLFKAKSFPPAKGSTYGARTVIREDTIKGGGCHFNSTWSLAVDPSNDHLYAVTNCDGKVFEYASAAEGSALVRGADEVQRLAVDASGGSFKLFSRSNNPHDFTADLSAGSSTVTSILGASGTGTLSAGSTTVASLKTAGGTFEKGRPISGPGIPEGTGTGDLSPGSNTIANVSLKSGTFAVGETVFAPGVPPEATITALGAGTITLSEAVMSNANPQVGAPILAATAIEEIMRGQAGEFIRLSLPASASGTAVGLVSKGTNGGGEGALLFGPGIPPGAFLGSFGPNQLAQGAGVLIGTHGRGDLSAGSNIATKVSSGSGTAFAVGQALLPQDGIPAGTTITAVEEEPLTEKEKEKGKAKSERFKLTLSNAATETIVATETKAGASLAAIIGASANGKAVTLVTAGTTESHTAAIPHNASAATVQAALEGLIGIGAGNVSVSGGPGGPGAASPYLITYKDKLAYTDVSPLGADGSGLSGPAASAALTMDTAGSDGAIGEFKTFKGAAVTRVDVAVWGKNHDVYVSGSDNPLTNDPKYSRASVIDGTDGHLKCETDGSETPQGGFGFSAGRAGVTVDQANGDLYVSDEAGNVVIDQFDSSCHYIGQLEHSFSGSNSGGFGVGPAVDNPYPGQTGYDSPNKGELYVASGSNPNKFHLWAFAPVGEAELEEFVLTVTKAGTGSGTATSTPAGIDCDPTCSAKYEQGTEVTLEAKADAGSTFSGWSGAGCSGTASCKVTMTEAKSVTAEFTKEETGPVFHKLTVSVTGSGSISADTGTISGCTSAGGPTCEGEYEQGAQVTLTETPGEGSLFAGWQTLQCDESTASTCEVTIGSGDEGVAASFIAAQPLSVAIQGPGTVTSSPGLISCAPFCEDSFPQGTKVTLTATPAPGAIFMAWKHCDSGGVIGLHCTVTMDKAKTVTAVFASGHALTVSKAEGSGPGKVQSSPTAIQCLYNCQSATAVYSATTKVTLKATPARHFHFAGFSGDCEGAGACEVAMGADREVKALFAPSTRYPLTLSRTGAGKGIVRSHPAGINCGYACVSITASYDEGEEVLLEVSKVALGSTFGGWSGGGCSGTVPTCTVAISEAKEVKAEFR